jgi:hypothetical protein
VRGLPLLLVAALTACGGDSSIAAARAAAAGAHVTADGVVSVPSGVIDAGFAIGDAHAGVHVAADSTVRVRVGERVRVRGVVTQIHGLRSIRPDAIERLGTAPAVRPRDVDTGDVGERTEGRMVRVHGRSVGAVQPDLPYGYKLRLDDGSGPVQVFLPPSVGAAFVRLEPGAEVAVTGFSGEYDSTYEVIPSTRADVHVWGPS